MENEYNIAEKLANHINGIIEALPLKEKGKSYLRFITIVDIFDQWYLIDPNLGAVESNMSYGIINEYQAQSYFNKFVENIKKTRFKALEGYSQNLRNNINVEESIAQLVQQLDKFNRKELELKFLGDKMTDEHWHYTAKQFLENEKNYLKDATLIDTYSGLTRNLLYSLSVMQGIIKSIRDDEVSRAIVLNYLLDSRLRNWRCKDESKWGKSPSGLKPGELDIAIESEKGAKMSIIECFQLSKGLDKAVISSHIKKLFSYDTGGTKQNYIVIFSEYRDFNLLWKKYFEYISQIEYEYKLVKHEDMSDTASIFSDIKIAKNEHIRNDRISTNYHIMVNLKK